MTRIFTLEYWMDADWYVGRLKEVPGVFSHGQSLAELKEDITDAYRMMLGTEDEDLPPGAKTLELGVEV